MKQPTFKGWCVIAGAILAAILTLIVALSDGVLTPEEADALSSKIDTVIDAVQTETANASEDAE